MRRMRVLFLLTVLLMFVANLVHSQDYHTIDSLKNLIKSEKSEKKLALYYSLIAEQYYFNFPDTAIYYCNKGMRYSEKNKDISDLSYYHNFLGVLYKNIAVYDSAIIHFEKAIPLYYQDEFERGAASAKNNLAQAQKLKGDYDEALDNFYSSLSIFEKYKDTLNIGELHSNIGALLLEIDELNAAEEHFQISRRQYQLANAELQEAWIVQDLGNLKLKQNDPKTAKRYFMEALTIWKKFDRIKEYNNCVLRLAESEMLIGEYTHAASLLEKTIDDFYKVNNLQGVSEAWMLLGKIDRLSGDYSNAIEQLNKSLEVSGIVKSDQLLMNIYNNLYLSYKAIEKPSEALKYHELFVAIKDSLFSTNRQKMIAEYQTKLNLANKEYFIKQLEDSTRQQQVINQYISRQNRQKQISIYGLVAVVVIILLLIYLIFKRYKTTRRLNDELEVALKEREVLIREVHHRVKNNLQIISSLLNLQADKTENESAGELLRISQSRIEAMSMIHENLYKSAKLSEINFNDYVENLCSYIGSSFNISARNIKFITCINKVNLDIDKLVPCGLIINELVTNSIKHAFESNYENEISINCKSEMIDGRENVELIVSDNGKGMPADFDLSRAKSLGLRLTYGLAKQLQANMFIKNEGGFKAIITFKNDAK